MRPEVSIMYVIFVKENGRHMVTGIAQDLDEVRGIIQGEKFKDKIDTGKAYLMEGDITLIRPETTPELLQKKTKRKVKNSYY